MCSHTDREGHCTYLRLASGWLWSVSLSDTPLFITVTHLLFFPFFFLLHPSCFVCCLFSFSIKSFHFSQYTHLSLSLPPSLSLPLSLPPSLRTLVKWCTLRDLTGRVSWPMSQPSTSTLRPEDPPAPSSSSSAHHHPPYLDLLQNLRDGAPSSTLPDCGTSNRQSKQTLSNDTENIKGFGFRGGCASRVRTRNLLSLYFLQQCRAPAQQRVHASLSVWPPSHCTNTGALYKIGGFMTACMCYVNMTTWAGLWFFGGMGGRVPSEHKPTFTSCLPWLLGLL